MKALLALFCAPLLLLSCSKTTETETVVVDTSVDDVFARPVCERFTKGDRHRSDEKKPADKKAARAGSDATKMKE